MNTIIRLLLLFVLAIFSAQSWGMSAKEVSNGQYGVDSQCLYIDVNATDVNLQAQNYGYDCFQNLSYYCDNKSTESQEDYGNLGSFFASIDGSVVTKGAGKVDDAARAAPEPNRIYSARELKRRADESGPFHNFPESFNNQIFKQGERRVISDRYIQYDLKGSLNGRSGTCELGVRPSASGRTEVITHRFFRPDPQ